MAGDGTGAVEQAFDFIALLTPQGTLIELGQAPAAVSGADAAAVLGKPLWEVDGSWGAWSPAAAAGLREAVAEAAAGRTTRQAAELLTADGRRITIMLRLVPLRDAQGRIVHLAAAGGDIAAAGRMPASGARQGRAQGEPARKGRAARLHADDARLRSLVENAPAASYIADPDRPTRPLFLNLGPQIEGLLGVTAAACLRDPELWHARIHPEDRERILAEIGRARRRHVPIGIEYRLIAQDGRAVWFRDEGRWLRDEAGRALIQGVMLDVTERKRIEARLLLAKEAGGVGTWDWDIGKGVAQVSDMWWRLYGRRPGGALVSFADWLAFLHPEDRARAEREVRQALEGGPYQTEFRIAWPNGEIRWIAARGQVERAPDGRALQMIGADVDITERKRIEAQLRDLVSQREALLQEAHHRIKNSIASVAAMLQMHARAQSSEQTQAPLLDAVRRIQTIGRIHEALYRSDRFEAIDVCAHLHAIMADIADSAATPQGAQPNVHVACTARTRLPAETMMSLSLIAVELVANAVKHAGGAGRPLRVHVRFEAGDPMRLTVADNGPGLPAAQEGETGFGLRLIELLVRNLDGRLTFERRAGSGAQVSVSFPRPTARPGARPGAPGG